MNKIKTTFRNARTLKFKELKIMWNRFEADCLCASVPFYQTFCHIPEFEKMYSKRNFIRHFATFLSLK